MVALPTPTPALTPAQQDQLLDLLSSPDHSLRDIAAALGVSLTHLTLFLTTGDEGPALTELAQSACATRARLVATALLPRALSALRLNLDTYDAAVRAHTATDAHHERARRAAHLLLRIATFRAPPAATAPRSPTPPRPPRSPLSPNRGDHPATPTPAPTAHTQRAEHSRSTPPTQPITPHATSTQPATTPAAQTHPHARTLRALAGAPP